MPDRQNLGLAGLPDSIVRITAAPATQSWTAWIASAPRNIAIFLKERVWLDSLLWFRSVVSVFQGATPAQILSRVDEIQQLHALLEFSGTSRVDREAVLNNFNRLQADTMDQFVRITPNSLNDYVNATSADEINETKARFVRECTTLMAGQNSLMGLAGFIALMKGNGSSPGATPPPTPPPTTVDHLALADVGPEERARAKEIEVLAKILPDGHALKDEYQCAVSMEELSNPVYDPHERRHVFQQATIHRIATTDRFGQRPVCPTCRNPVREANLLFDVKLQKEIRQKMAEAMSGMSDADITTRLPLAITELQAGTPPLTPAAAKLKLHNMLPNLPEHVTVAGTQREIRARVTRLFNALP